MNNLSIEELKDMRAYASARYLERFVRLIDEAITIRELKGDQVPVAYCQTTRDKIKHVAMQALSHALKNKQLEMADIHALTMMLMPLFTATQNPVVLPEGFYPDGDTDCGLVIDRAKTIAAIEAAGGIVKDGE